MNKSPERWALVCPKRVSEASPAHIANLIADAQADIGQMARALRRAEQFISGFEGDDLQDGVVELLRYLRAALSEQGGAHG